MWAPHKQWSLRLLTHIRRHLQPSGHTPLARLVHGHTDTTELSGRRVKPRAYCQPSAFALRPANARAAPIVTQVWSQGPSPSARRRKPHQMVCQLCACVRLVRPRFAPPPHTHGCGAVSRGRLLGSRRHRRQLTWRASWSSPSGGWSPRAARGRSSCTPAQSSTCTAPSSRAPARRCPRP